MCGLQLVNIIQNTHYQHNVSKNGTKGKQHAWLTVDKHTHTTQKQI